MPEFHNSSLELSDMTGFSDKSENDEGEWFLAFYETIKNWFKILAELSIIFKI